MFVLRQHESGTPVAEIVRKLGFTTQTFDRWKKKFAGLEVAEVWRIEEEDRKLKQAGGRTEPGQEHAAGRPGKRAVRG
ncbi:MAG: transposase [Planctomycetaceae bacterium]|nr:transposase [Planctomycetaceae bacterium]